MDIGRRGFLGALVAPFVARMLAWLPWRRVSIADTIAAQLEVVRPEIESLFNSGIYGLRYHQIVDSTTNYMAIARPMIINHNPTPRWHTSEKDLGEYTIRHERLFFTYFGGMRYAVMAFSDEDAERQAVEVHQFSGLNYYLAGPFIEPRMVNIQAGINRVLSESSEAMESEGKILEEKLKRNEDYWTGARYA